MANLRHIFRLKKVATVLAKHDALFLFEQWGVAPGAIAWLKFFYGRRSKLRPGERLANALIELGPVFIKLGQALSTRSDLLSEEVARDLALLRDNLPPFSTEEAKKIIEKELGKPIEELFQSFDDVPIAAASIAQVHFAEDNDGNKVAVKVLRPDVEARFNKDFETLFWLAARMERRIPKLKRLKLQEVVETFAETVRLEMDLRMEAAACMELHDNFLGDAELHVPKVDWQRTSQRVMTLERIHGINVDDVKALKKAGHDPKAIVQRAAVVLFKMAFRDGYFHADLHPGNLFVDKEGRLVVVDFGIMGRLDLPTRIFIAGMLRAFLRRDFYEAARLHFAAGYVPRSQSVDAFAQACRSIAEPILGLPQNQISIARLLAQLFKVSEDFSMELQPQLLLLQKSMMLAEGVGRKLYPEVNMWKLAEGLIEKMADEYLGIDVQVKMRVDKCRDALDTIDHLLIHAGAAITPQGLKLHPDVVAQLMPQKRRKKLWPCILLIATVIFLLYSYYL